MMGALPPWFGNDRQKQNSRSRKQERNRAKEVGGRTQAGSGSSYRAPQDVVAPDHLEQIKYTDKHTFSLDARELSALLDDALRWGREANFVIDFERDGIRAMVTVDRNSRRG